MTCREFLEALAEDPESGGDAAPAASAHRATCEACAAAADDARDAWQAVLRSDEAAGETVPPARAADAWRDAGRTARTRRLVSTVRFAGRAAVVLLAATGAFAALDARVESTGGRTTVALALPWVEDETTAGAPIDAAALRQVVEDAVAAYERRTAERETLRDEIQTEASLRWAQWLDDRRRGDTEALATELVGLRADLAATRWVHHEILAGGSRPPALPDPR